MASAPTIGAMSMIRLMGKLSTQVEKKGGPVASAGVILVRCRMAATHRGKHAAAIPAM